MFCTQCGAPMGESAFCAQCGAPVPASSRQPPPEMGQPSPAPAAESPPPPDPAFWQGGPPQLAQAEPPPAPMPQTAALPYGSAPPPKKRMKKRTKIILLVVGVLFLVSVTAGIVSLITGQPLSTRQRDRQAGQDDGRPGIAATLEKDGLAITLDAVMYSDTNQNGAAPEGYDYRQFQFTIQNDTDEAVDIEAEADFWLLVDGDEAEITLATLLGGQSQMTKVTLAPGKKISGFVQFLVPLEWDELAFGYQPPKGRELVFYLEPGKK